MTELNTASQGVDAAFQCRGPVVPPSGGRIVNVANSAEAGTTSPLPGRVAYIPHFDDYPDVSDPLETTISTSRYSKDGLSLRKCTGYSLST